MRKLVVILLWTLSLPFLFVACDDEEKKDAVNTFTYDGRTYTIANRGFIEYFGQNENFNGQLVGTYNYDINLVSTDLTVNPTTGNLDGTGEVLYFWLNTSNPSALANGTYTVNVNTNGTYPANSITPAALAIDFQPTGTAQFEDVAILAVLGTATINKSGDEYTITFDLTASNNKKIKGNFKGTLD